MGQAEQDDVADGRIIEVTAFENGAHLRGGVTMMIPVR